MSREMTDATHAEFTENFDLSRDGVKRIGMYLESHRYEVVYPKQRKAPHQSQWREYSDDGDLFVTPYGDVSDLRIEVRYIQSHFTGEHDWPFSPKFIANNVGSWARAGRKPEWIFYPNKALTHTALLSVERSRHDWWSKPLTYGRHGHIHDVFYVPMKHLTWFELVDGPWEAKGPDG